MAEPPQRSARGKQERRGTPPRNLYLQAKRDLSRMAQDSGLGPNDEIRYHLVPLRLLKPDLGFPTGGVA